MLKGVLFDLDGVIADTAEYHFQAWADLAKDIGIEIDREFNEKLKGVSRMESLEIILEHGNKQDRFTQEEKEALASKKNNHYVELINNVSKEDILPGVEDLIKDLKKNNIKLALCSASKNGTKILKQLEILDCFDYIADPVKVKNSKPAPDIFLEGLRGLNLKPDEAVGIEDAIAGVEAIQKAGMIAIGVGVKGDITVNSTEELTYDLILNAIK